ncbi:hypothetical protein ACEWX3_25790 [Mycobacterium sp. G7A2]|uniref:hypothetical protein n=1 Tax=Mycobacterium sp. G7A2 TaxID=3317307 RepID=UPI0035A85140
MATQGAANVWDRALENVERTDDSPSGRLARQHAMAGNKTGIEMPANSYEVLSTLYTAPIVELWAADPPADPGLRELLQPVRDAANFTPYEPFEPQVDRLLEATATARAGLAGAGATALAADQVIADMQTWLKINLLVAGTSHLGPLKVIDDEIAKQVEPAQSGFRLPPRHWDFATNELVHRPTKTSLPMAVFAASVDQTVANSWAEILQPDPNDQPWIMKQFAAQLIVTFYTEWEEYYRPALAKALGCKPDDIKLDYFGDVRNMRQDYVHTRGLCRNAAKNKMLKWFTKGQSMIPTPANYLELLTEFPSEALKVKPPEFVRDRLPVGANAKAELIVEFDRAVAASGITKDAALDQALAAWIAAQTESGTGG